MEGHSLTMRQTEMILVKSNKLFYNMNYCIYAREPDRNHLAHNPELHASTATQAHGPLTSAATEY